MNRIALHRQSSTRPGRGRRAFSLIEILTSMAILTVIILMLFSVFDATQKGLLSTVSQVDVMEGGRSAADIISRDLEQMMASGRSNVVNFYSRRTPSFSGGSPRQTVQEMIFGDQNLTPRTNLFQEMFFLTQTNKRWMGIGYRVYEDNNGVGTLYRGVFMTNDTRVLPTNLVAVFRETATTRHFTNFFSPVIDGVLHFDVSAFSPGGIEWKHENANVRDLRIPYPSLTTGGSQYHWVGGPTNQDFSIGTNLANVVMRRFAPGISEVSFLSNGLPNAVSIEMGILDPQTQEQLKSLGGGLVDGFLRDKASDVQLFRKHVPVRSAPR